MTVPDLPGIDRRRLIAGAAAGLALTAAPALADGSASREFRVRRGGSDIGRHLVTAAVADGVCEVAIEIDLAIRVLGITAYRYRLRNRERWQGGRILTVRSEVNDDGSAERAVIERAGDQLAIDGTGYSGPAPIDAVTTSYLTRSFVDRRPWISTQSGRVLQITATGGGTPARYRIAGDIETTLIYDAAGEWIGCEFDAGGTLASYEIIGGSGSIGALWASV